VTAGTNTFRFNTYPNELRYNTNYPVTWTTGNQFSPNSGTASGSLTIIDKDNFKIGNYRFVRGRLEGTQIVKTPAVLPPQRRTIIRDRIVQTLDDDGNVIATRKERVIETVAIKEGGYWNPDSKVNQEYTENFP
jgi:hypothetical protein